MNFCLKCFFFSWLKLYKKKNSKDRNDISKKIYKHFIESFPETNGESELHSMETIENNGCHGHRSLESVAAKN